jgi:chemotaxis protein CheX
MHVESTQVIEAIETIWSTMLGLSAEAQPNAPAMLDPIRPNVYTCCIQISGKWEGAVTVECSNTLARRIAAIMFSSDPLEVNSEQVMDALGEMTNMVGGNIKSLLPEPSRLSMPSVTKGSDYIFTVAGGRSLARLTFQCDGKPFQVAVIERNL